MNNFVVNLIPALNDNYIFLFSCLKTGITACVDPCEAEPVINFLEKHKLKLSFILNTHHHFDHIGGNERLKAKYHCKIVGYKYDAHRIPGIDLLVEENDSVKIGDYLFKIIFVPGHTKGHIAYFCSEAKILFIGDTVFSSGCGRLFEGTAEEMYNSLEKIKKLPLNTQIYCAHEYTLNNLKFALAVEPNNQNLIAKQKQCLKLREKNIATIPTNLADELNTNPFLRTISPELRKNIGKTSDSYNEEVFAKLRKLKDSF